MAINYISRRHNLESLHDVAIVVFHNVAYLNPVLIAEQIVPK